ncbi:MAG: hypothetical protein OXD43_02530, partial [Bacteroidetes bacterium]|nr:hypothetical protein [Bacteroidota bacterium]
HSHRYRRFAYSLTRIPARLAEVCDWLHLHTTGLSPATFCQLAWRTSITFHTNLHAPAKPASFFALPRLPGNNLYVMLRYALTVSVMGYSRI